MTRADILMVTHRSDPFLHLSLPRLLSTCGEDDHVWLWHNGGDEQTLDALQTYLDDPRVARFHHSEVNVRLRGPLTWLMQESRAAYLGKVDDDCLVSPGWIDTFVAAHEANPSFGVVGSWRHPDEDLIPELADAKTRTFAGGHTLMQNVWVQGSGFLLKRDWVDRVGVLQGDETFPRYCIKLAQAGAVNGWYRPFVREDHMDDPRSPSTLIRSDADLARRMPLSARATGVRTVADWQAQLQRSAAVVQAASLDPRDHVGWRARAGRRLRRLRRITGRPVQW
jgi:hypothetical protein